MKAVSVRRVGLDKPLLIDLEKANEDDPVNNIELKPNDAIFVEKLRDDAYITVDGGFVKPGKLVFGKSMTLTQAVAEAGGPAIGAKLNDGTILRNPDGDPKHSKVIQFKWTAIQKGKMPDIGLQQGDTVYLPAGTPRLAPDIWQMIGSITPLLWLLRP
jgi:hypothetical protein